MLGKGITVHLTEKFGQVSGRWKADEHRVLQAMPARKRWDEGVLLFDPTNEALVYLRDRLPAASWPQSDALPFFEDVMTPTGSSRSYSMKTTLYDYQQKFVDRSKEEKSWAFMTEMGTGKSLMLLATGLHLYNKGEIDGLFILAPNGVHRQWVYEQIPAHYPEDIETEAHAWKIGKPPPGLMERSDPLKVLSMNIEAINFEKGYAFAEEFLQAQRCLFILDESTRIKSPSAKRTKKALKLSRMAEYKRIASGAPVTQGLEDLYTQCAFLDPHLLGFRSFYSYRAKVCITQPVPGAMKGAVRIVGYRNQDFLQSKLATFASVATKADCLDLPPKVYTTRDVELTAEQKRLYKQFAEEYYAEFEGNEIEAPLAITRLMRMQQVLSGFLPNDDGELMDVPSNRLAVLKEVIDECQGKVIIWARFREDIRRIAEALEGSVTYFGGTSQQDRADAIEGFVRGDVKYFIGNPTAAGTGLNLAVAQTVIYYSNDFNADTRWQSEDRAHRIGMSGPVTYVDLIAQNTIDTQVVTALRRKKSVADVVMSIKP